MVTGAATGLGRELALTLARRGAHVVLWDINKEELDRTVALVRELGAEVEAHLVNLADPKSIAACAKATGSVWGVINNAGIVEPQEFLESSDAKNELTFKVNTFAAMYTAKQFLPSMVANNSGAFVTVASSASYFGAPKMTTYAASKAAARVFIETLAHEIAPKAPDVHLAVVCPSHIDTKLFEGFAATGGAPTLNAAQLAETIVKDVIENSSPLLVLPFGARFGTIMKGILPEGVWRKMIRPSVADLMTNFNSTQADTIFSKMSQSKL